MYLKLKMMVKRQKKKSIHISIFYLPGIMWRGFILPTGITKTETKLRWAKYYKTMILKTLDNRQQSTLISKR